MTTAQPLPRGEITQQPDGIYELFPVPTDQDTLHGILTDCLAEWERIRIGLLIPGAVWEIKPPRPPRTGFLDGYLTVDFEEWHLHLCIGEHTVRAARGGPPAPPPPAPNSTAASTPIISPRPGVSASSTAAASSRSPSSSPTPTSTSASNTEKQPVWSRLYLWDRLRAKYLGQGEDGDGSDGGGVLAWVTTNSPLLYLERVLDVKAPNHCCIGDHLSVCSVCICTLKCHSRGYDGS